MHHDQSRHVASAPVSAATDGVNLSAIGPEALGQLALHHAYRPRRDPEVWLQLTADDQYQRTVDVLSDMRFRNEKALGKKRDEIEQVRLECLRRGAVGRGDWVAAKADYEQWRVKATNFARNVTNAIREVNRAREELHRNEHLLYREGVEQLALAIDEHRAAVDEADLEPEPHDESLWGVLEAVRVLDGDRQMVPVAGMLAQWRQGRARQ